MGAELSIIMVPTTKCNLSCRHCFEKHSDHVMSHGDLKIVLRKIRDYAVQKDIGAITFYWQGGEVLLLGPDWFEGMDETASDVFDGSQVTTRHKLQSNLIGYTSKWKPVVQKLFHDSIGSSLDYPSLYRGFREAGGEDFNEIWLRACNRARADGIEISVISVLNEQTLKMSARDFLEYYCVHMGLSNIQINWPFDVSARKGQIQSFFLPPIDMGRFLVDLFETWATDEEKWYQRIKINPFCELIDVFSFLPRPSRCNCIWSGNCADSFFCVGPDGSVGLCDCWVTSLPEFTFGNLLTQSLTEIEKSEARNRLRGRIDIVLSGDCSDCPYLGICFGGCIIRAYGCCGIMENKDPYCAAYKLLFDKVFEYARKSDSVGRAHEQIGIKEKEVTRN